MKKIILFLLVFPSSLFATIETSKGNISFLDEYHLSLDNEIQPLACRLKIFTNFNIKNTKNSQGCCSSHQGECGCQAGRVVCCDGGASPSCTC